MQAIRKLEEYMNNMNKNNNINNNNTNNTNNNSYYCHSNNIKFISNFIS